MIKYIITTLIALFCMVAFANAAPAKQMNKRMHKNQTVQVCEFAKHKQMKKFERKRMHKRCYCKCQQHKRFHKGWSHKRFHKGWKQDRQNPRHQGRR